MDVFDFGSHLETPRGLEAVAEGAPLEAEGTLFEGAGTLLEEEGAVSDDPELLLSFLFLAAC